MLAKRAMKDGELESEITAVKQGITAFFAFKLDTVCLPHLVIVNEDRSWTVMFECA